MKVKLKPVSLIEVALELGITPFELLELAQACNVKIYDVVTDREITTQEVDQILQKNEILFH